MKECFEEKEHKRLTAIVLTKPPYIHKNKIKHGYHIQFPEVFVSTEARQYIEQEVDNRLKHIQIDKMATKCWLLYGSQKNATSGRYTASHCISPDGKRGDIETYVQNYTLYDPDEEPFKAKMKNLPRVLSTIPFNRYCIVDVNTSKAQTATCNKAKAVTSKRVYPVLSKEDSMTECKLLLKHIPDSRADNYDDWFAIGSAIHTMMNGSEEGLNLFLEFSRRSDKFDEDVCRKLYDNYNGSHTVGTLIYMTKVKV